MLKSELDSSQFKWKGEDDSVMLKKDVNTPPADQGNLIALEPQRIRQFKISYSKEEAQKTSNIKPFTKDKIQKSIQVKKDAPNHLQKT